MFRTKAPNRSKVSTIITDFVQNTSLLGVSHFLRSKSIIWLIAYLLCVIMSIMQSWNVTVKYFQQQTFQISTITSKNLLPFPSVTVCSYTALRDGFNFSLIPGFNTSVPKKLEDCSDHHKMKEWRTVLFHNHIKAVHYLRSLSNAERLQLGVNIEQEFILQCKFGHQRCNFSDPKDLHIFNHPYFGNCFTFNPAFDEDSAKEADVQTDLHLKINTDAKGYRVSFSRAKAVLLIHQPGTAPLMESPGVIELVTGDNVMLELDLLEMNTIKRRTSGMITCVDNTDETYRKRSRYYTPESPYRYCLESCIESCTQDHAGKECGSISRFLPVQSPEYEFNKTTRHCLINYPIHMESCNCPIACKRLDYDINSRQTEGLPRIPCDAHHIETSTTQHPEKSFHHHFKDPNNRHTSKFAHHDYKEMSHHYHADKPLHNHHEHIWRYGAKMVIKFRRNIYEKIEEALCYSLSDYLGVLGGNISLWIGLCVISLLELLELVFKLVAVAICPSCISPEPASTIPPCEMKHLRIHPRTSTFFYKYT